jgi:hypothetical protein
MPIDTQFGTFSIGKDVAIDVVLKSGRHLRISNVTDFDAKPKTKKLTSLGIDGINRHGVIPEGYGLTITLDRANRAVDDWWADYEEAYYRGDVVQNVLITQTIKEGDGSISQWRFEGVALNLDDLGNWKADSYVKQKLTGEAAFRRRVQ